MKEQYIITLELITGYVVDVPVEAYSFEDARQRACAPHYYRGEPIVKAINWRRRRGQDRLPKIRAI